MRRNTIPHSFRPMGLLAGRRICPQFNVKQIKCTEAKLTKVTQVMEALENKKEVNYGSIFKGIYTNSTDTNKRRRQKGNRRKSNERKRKRTENNVQRVSYGICVENRQGNVPPQCLVYSPSLAIPKECIIKIKLTFQEMKSIKSVKNVY